LRIIFLFIDYLIEDTLQRVVFRFLGILEWTRDAILGCHGMYIGIKETENKWVNEQDCQYWLGKASVRGSIWVLN
jgi:hypothetical protein